MNTQMIICMVIFVATLISYMLEQDPHVAHCNDLNGCPVHHWLY